MDYGPHIKDQCFKEAGYRRDRELPPYLREGAFPPGGGDKQQLTVIVPGDSVRELVISEVKGGTVHGQSEVTA